MDDEQISLRKMAFEGIPYDDDWLVIWRGMPIGRILKQSGIAWGRPDWFWSITIQYVNPRGLDRGVAADFEGCKVAFKAAWADMRARLSDEDIAKERRHYDELQSRSR